MGIDSNWGLSNVLNIKDYQYGYLVETSGAYYFIPKNCSDTTNTITFSHGGGGDAHDWEEYLKTGKLDAIFAIPKSNLSYSNYDVSQSMLTEDIAAIQRSLGITNNNLFTVEHSAGGPSSIYYAAQNILNNPDIGPQTCVLIDPANGAGHVDPEFLTNGEMTASIQILGNNHANIIGIENTSDINRTLGYYQILGDAGCNVTVIKMKGFNIDPHVEISKYSFNNGILSYLAGDKPLEEVFTENVDYIKQYDASTGTWKDVSINDISGYVGSVLGTYGNFDSSFNYYSQVDFGAYSETVNNLKNLELFPIDDTTISSDDKFVYTSMNEMRTNLKNTSLLACGSTNIGCQSTTIVPTCAENFLSDYFSVVFNLSEKLSQETQNAVNISKKLDETDKEMEQTAQNMSNVIYVNVPAQNTQSRSAGTTVNSSQTNDKEAPIVNSTSTTTTDSSTSSSTETINPPVTPDKEDDLAPSSDRHIDLQPYSTSSLLNKDLTERVYDITADDLNRLFESWAKKTGNTDSPLLGTGESWIKACDEVDIDPLSLVGICGLETGRGGSRAMPWMTKKNFFGLKYVDVTGDGTGRSTAWSGKADLFDSMDDALLASAKRIKNFYYGQHGAHSMAGIGRVGYSGKSGDTSYANSCAAIMKEALDYITGTNGGI